MSRVITGAQNRNTGRNWKRHIWCCSQMQHHGEKFALKKFFVDKSEFAKKEIEVHQQIKALGTHPNLAVMEKFFELQGQVCIVMKLFDTNLKKVLRKRLMEEPPRFFQASTCLSIFHKLLSGLHYLHSHNMCHRDIKVLHIVLY